MILTGASKTEDTYKKIRIFTGGIIDETASRVYCFTSIFCTTAADDVPTGNVFFEERQLE